jgi:hypothetical protein
MPSWSTACGAILGVAHQMPPRVTATSTPSQPTRTPPGSPMSSREQIRPVALVLQEEYIDETILEVDPLGIEAEDIRGW